MSRSIGLAVVLLSLLPIERASAQNTDDNSVFDFSLPGARSRGIGGAFVAIADDATSVYSNPAGLLNLFRPEVSFELRHWHITSLAVDHGHAFGPVSNVGIDTINGIQDRSFTSDLTGVSFVSFAYPKDRWSVGVFSHLLANYQMDRQTNGAFFNCNGGYRGLNPAPPFCEQSQADGIDRVFPADQSMDLSIRSYGASFAVRPIHGLSLGVTVQTSNLKLNSTAHVFAARGALKFQPPNRSPQNVELSGLRLGDDWAWGVNAGALWDVSRQWTVGGTFRQGPRFHYLAQTTTGPATLSQPGLTFVNDPNSPFKVPDTWAFGAAFRPSNYWRVGVEYDYVRFKQLLENVENTSTTSGDPEGLLVVQRLKIDNSHQIRVGAEYSVKAFGGRLLSFRGGSWYDPNHLPYFQVDNPSTGYPGPLWALYFPKRDGDVHFSGGVGFASQRHFQVDFAVDYAESISTVALSAIWRF